MYTWLEFARRTLVGQRNLPANVKGLETLKKIHCPVSLGRFWVSIKIMASEPELGERWQAKTQGGINIESGLEKQLTDTATGDSEGVIGGMPAPEPEIGLKPAATPPADIPTDTESVPAEEIPLGMTPDTPVEAAQGGGPDASLEPTTDIGDAFAQVADALGQLINTLPVWLLIVLVAVFAVITGVIVGVRMSRRTLPEPPRQPAEAAVVRHALPAPESPVFVKYQEFLERKGVSAKEFDAQLRGFAENYKTMRQNLRDLIPGDKSLDDAVEEVRTSLDQGDFDHALELLVEVGKREGNDGVTKHLAAQKHLMAAAISRAVAGDIQMARMAYAEAAEFYREAVEALPDFQEDLHGEYLNKYGTASYQAGEPETAIAAFERALQILERKLGKNHPDVATALNNLALLNYSRGNYDAAEPLYQRSLAIDEHTLGADHPGVATDLNNLALLYKKQGNLDAAEPLLRRAMEIKEKQFDPGHPSLVTGLKNYASLLRALGRDEEAEVFERKATVLPPKRTRSSAE